MLRLITNIGNFRTIKDLLLEMKFTNTEEVEMEITFCLRTLEEKKIYTKKDLEELLNWDNCLYWESQFLQKAK